MRLKRVFAAGVAALMLSMTVATALPVTGLTAQAASYTTYSTLNWSGLLGKTERTLDGDKTVKTNYTMTVEVGQSFNIGDFATGRFVGRLSDAENATKAAAYTSSKKSVATVTKKGVVTPKKKGSTVMSIKLGDETIKLTLKVVAKKYSTREDVTKIQDSITSLLKKYPKESSITVKNSMTAAKKIAAINKELRAFLVENNKVNTYGFYRTDYYGNTATPDYANRLVVTNLAQYRDLVETFTDLQYENSAYNTTKAGFSVKSASAKFNTSKIKVNLSKKVTATQVFSLVDLNDYSQSFKASMKVKVSAYIVKVDEQGNESYYDWAYSTVKKGTKSFTLTLDSDLLEKGNYKVYLTDGSIDDTDTDPSTDYTALLKNNTPVAAFTVQ